MPPFLPSKVDCRNLGHMLDLIKSAEDINERLVARDALLNLVDTKVSVG